MRVVLCVSVVSWSQTSEDVTVILHAGRPLKQNDIEVVFDDDRVNVGLTGTFSTFVKTIFHSCSLHYCIV